MATTVDGKAPSPGSGTGTGFRPERVYAVFYALQVVLGVLLWVVAFAIPPARPLFELVEGRPSVTDAFLFGDILLIVVFSAVAGWGLEKRRSWAVAAAAFTTGGVVYPTLYLIGWLSFEGTGAAPLGLMAMVSTINLWVLYQVWRLHR